MAFHVPVESIFLRAAGVPRLDGAPASPQLSSALDLGTSGTSATRQISLHQLESQPVAGTPGRRGPARRSMAPWIAGTRHQETNPICSPASGPLAGFSPLRRTGRSFHRGASKASFTVPRTPSGKSRGGHRKVSGLINSKELVAGSCCLPTTSMFLRRQSGAQSVLLVWEDRHTTLADSPSPITRCISRLLVWALGRIGMRCALTAQMAKYDPPNESGSPVLGCMCFYSAGDITSR